METIQTLIFFACCFAVLYLHAWWGWQVFVVRPRLDVFKGHGVTLSIDRASNQLTYQRGTGEQLAFPLNSMELSYFRKIEHKNYEKWHHGSSAKINTYTMNGHSTGTITPPREGYLEKGTKEVLTGDTAITLVIRDVPLYFFEKWATWVQQNIGSKSTSTAEAIVRFDLTSRQAEALKRWANAHRKELVPNEAGARKTWDEKCRAQLEKCRSQKPKGAQKNCIERFEYSANFAIKYLYCTEDGRIFIATGQDPVLVEVDPTTVRFWSSKGQHSMVWCIQVDETMFKLETVADITNARKILGKESVTS